MTDSIHQAADLLIAARRDPAKRLAALPEALRPADQASAYAIQHLVAATFPGIGGWKVGASGPDAPPICGALPTSGVVPSPAVLSSASHMMRGIEAEVAFRIGRDLPPRRTPYSRDEVMDAMESAHPAIEVLESRYLDSDAVDAVSNLADTQMHGGFVWGAPVAGWRGVDFAAETVVQEVDGSTLTRTGNPAGDMVRLVVWLANEGSVWAGGLKAGQFVTCGSWTGKTLAGPNATVRVRFPSLGVAELSFQ
jgi:2-keto-4-pentenoate hydratase